MKISLVSRVFVWTGLLLLAGVIACSNDMPIQGFDLSNPGSRGVVDSTAIKDIDFEVTYSDSFIPTGSLSASLLLGSLNGIENRLLLRIDDIPDTVEVKKATLILVSNSVVGDQAKTSFQAFVHNVLDEWDEDTVTDANFSYNVDAAAIAAAEIVSASQVFDENDSLVAESVRFQFDERGVELVNGWADTIDAVPNFGVLIDFDNSTFVKNFFNRGNVANHPTLELEVMKSTDLDTLVFPISADAFLAHQLAEPVTGPHYVDHLFGYHSIVKFDLSAIPRESTINRALMVLAVDRANTFITDTQFSIQVLRLLKPFTEPDSISLDFSFEATVGVSPTATTVTFPSDLTQPQFRRMVQDWVAGLVENNGIIIRSRTPGFSISRVAFFSTNQSSPDAPRLSIDYSIAPTISNRN